MNIKVAKFVFVIGIVLSLALVPFSEKLLLTNGDIKYQTSVVALVLALVSAWLLSLFGAYGLAKHYKETIFRSMLCAFIAALGGLTLRLTILSLPNLVLFFPYFVFLLFEHSQVYDLLLATSAVLTFLGLVILWAYFVMDAYLKLFKVSGVQKFRKAGRLTWIGAIIFVIMTIVSPLPNEASWIYVRLAELAIGPVLILSGQALAVVATMSIRG